MSPIYMKPRAPVICHRTVLTYIRKSHFKTTNRRRRDMKLLLPLLTTLAVWAAPVIGQNPSTSGPSPSKPSSPVLPVNPPNTGNTAVSTNVNPQQTSRARPSPGLGIFKASNNSPWGVNPPNQLPGAQVPGPWGVQPQITPGWGPQPPPSNPMMQRMPWMTNIASMVDLLDIPCGISARRRRLMMGALDNSEPFCECRYGGCDGALPDLSGDADCPGIYSCCCTGNPYNSYATASVMQSNMQRIRSYGMMPAGVHGMNSAMHGGMPGYMPAGMARGLPSGMPTGARMAGNMQSGMPVGRSGPAVPRRGASTTYPEFLNMWYRR